MAQRRRIALIFEVLPDWMGGTYYVLNIINTLNALPDDEKPEIVLLTKNSDDFLFLKERSQYPYLIEKVLFRKPSLFIRGLNKIYRLITKKKYNLIIPKFKESVEAIYPVNDINRLSSDSKKIYWIPDFQEKYLPELFDLQNLKLRDTIIKDIIKKGDYLVLSSHNAFDSLLKFYPEAKKLNLSIYNFTVSIPDLSKIDKSLTYEKFDIDRPFFYCANQFWIHKNHKLLFEAVKLLKDRGHHNFLLLCSGGINDFRHPNYMVELKKYLEDNSLENNIKILGLIDREDQLCLMQNSEAIIQPSLFEGWNTSVEEAKALNKFLILSDLDVHKEQVPQNAFFFNRNSAIDIADKIEEFLNNKPEIKPINYKLSIQKAARNFLNIMYQK